MSRAAGAAAGVALAVLLGGCALGRPAAPTVNAGQQSSSVASRAEQTARGTPRGEGPSTSSAVVTPAAGPTAGQSGSASSTAASSPSSAGSLPATSRAPVTASPLPSVPATAARSGGADALEVASLGWRLRLVPAEVRGGELSIPDQATRAGVYWPSGEQGTGVAVVVAHVAWQGRPGAFAELRRLAVGDVVTSRVAGSVVRWKVTEVSLHPRGRLPGKVFASGGDPALALVTCAGPIRHGEFTRNLLVWAEPA